jgi:hypothetical protein
VQLSRHSSELASGREIANSVEKLRPSDALDALQFHFERGERF